MRDKEGGIILTFRNNMEQAKNSKILDREMVYYP